MTKPVLFQRPLQQEVTADDFLDLGRFECPGTGLSGLIVFNLGLARGTEGWQPSRLHDANEYGFLGGDLVAAAAGRLLSSGAVTNVVFSGGGHPSFLRRFPDYPPEAAVYKRVALQRARELSPLLVPTRDLRVSMELASQDTRQNFALGIPPVESALLGSDDMRPIGVLTRHWHVPRCMWQSQLALLRTSRPLVFISAESIELSYDEHVRVETEHLYRSELGQLRRRREQAGIDEAARTIEALERALDGLEQQVTFGRSPGPAQALSLHRKSSPGPGLSVPSLQLPALHVERR